MRTAHLAREAPPQPDASHPDRRLQYFCAVRIPRTLPNESSYWSVFLRLGIWDGWPTRMPTERTRTWLPIHFALAAANAPKRASRYDFDYIREFDTEPLPKFRPAARFRIEDKDHFRQADFRRVVGIGECFGDLASIQTDE